MAGEFPVGPVVLGYLLEGPAHGYELLARLHADLGRVWRVAPSQLYATLDRLERHGLIRGTRVEQESRPARIRYTLTPQGAELFWRWVTAPVPRLRLLRSQLLPKLFFLLRLAPERASALLTAQREVLLALEAKVRAEEPQDPFGKALRSFRLHQLSAGLAWIDSLLQGGGGCASS
ncbi:MAG: PadR family transcriptional regulator [Candidatus Bipolaricaulaceae bacterium]